MKTVFVKCCATPTDPPSLYLIKHTFVPGLAGSLKTTVKSCAEMLLIV